MFFPPHIITITLLNTQIYIHEYKYIILWRTSLRKSIFTDFPEIDKHSLIGE